MNAIQKRRAAAGQSGFTLIELLVVIAILGILAGVVVFAVGNTTDNAGVKACEVELRTVKTAVEAYKGNEGTLPPALVDLTTAADSSFLQDDPSADWTYTADTPSVGKFTLTRTAGGKYGDAKFAPCD